MYSYSKHSMEQLATVDQRLVIVFQSVLRSIDHRVLEGARNKEKQNIAFRHGRSKLKWPNSSHNATPSRAIDVAPWPIDWEDRDRFVYFGGFVVGISSALGYRILWGGDWDMDHLRDGKDQTFDDLVHFEIVDG